MVGENQLKNVLSVLSKSLGICSDVHSCSWRSGTGSLERALIGFDHTHSASTIDGKVCVVAEGRHLDSCFSDDLKNVLLSIDFCENAINGHILLVCHVKPP